jgi:cysteine desulfurase
MRSVYLDYASTTYVDKKVLSKMLPYFSRYFGNPSSFHLPGRIAKQAMDTARASIANILKAKRHEIIFTGSGTESDNLAIIGGALANSKFGKHIIISKIEHKAVLESAKKLEKLGFDVTYLNVDHFGLVKLAELKKSLRKDTILISIQYANNEIGTIQDISGISKVIKSFRKEKPLPLFHTDACQAAGALTMDVNELGIDLMTINGSKIYGPKGVGVLYVKRDTKLDPQILGGGQEMSLRSGTENVPFIVGLSEALLLAEQIRNRENKRQIKLRDYLIKNVLKLIDGVVLNGHQSMRLPNNINLSIRGVEGESLLLMLDKYGVYCSTGSACSSTDLIMSHVLSAIDALPELAQGSIRITLGRATSKDDINYVLKMLPMVVNKLRRISSVK